MAHELAVKNGEVQMVYTGAMPWHRLGKKLDGVFTSEEALRVAQLDYKVELIDCYGLGDDGYVEVPNRKVIRRKDTRKAFTTVGNTYVPVQNREAFEFMDSLVGEKLAMYHTAGALRGGAVVWMLCELPGEIRVKQTDDVLKQFVLLKNAHDGSSAVHVLNTSVRVVCANTLAAAMEGKQECLTIRHSGEIKDKIATAREILGISLQQWGQFQELVDALADIQMRRSDLESFFTDVTITPREREGKEPSAYVKGIRDELVSNFESGIGADMSGIKGTMWAAVNAVTEYVDHSRGKRNTDAQRVESMWFGSGAALKSRALKLAASRV